MRLRASRIGLVLALLLGPASALPGLAAFAAEPVPTPRPIFFATGSTRGTVGGNVRPGVQHLYSLKAAAGRYMTVTITAPDDNAVFRIYQPGTTVARDPDGLLQFTGDALESAGEADDATRWTGRLTKGGTYLLVVGSTRGNARYSIDVKIE